MFLNLLLLPPTGTRLRLQAKGDKEAKDLSLEADYSNLNTIYELRSFVDTVLHGPESSSEEGINGLEDPKMPWSLSLSVARVLEQARRSGGIQFPADIRTVLELHEAVAKLQQ